MLLVESSTTLVAVILNHIGLYCEQSWSPGWGHIWVRDTTYSLLRLASLITGNLWQISAIISISVTIAMYCLFQLYVCVAEELAPHHPVLKLFAVKAVGRLLPVDAYRMVLIPTRQYF